LSALEVTLIFIRIVLVLPVYQLTVASYSLSATLGILIRSLRIGQTDTDHVYEAIVQPAGIPHQMRSLIELMDETGYQLRRSGKDTTNTPSKLVLEQFNITNKSTKRKLMN